MGCAQGAGVMRWARSLRRIEGGRCAAGAAVGGAPSGVCACCSVVAHAGATLSRTPFAPGAAARACGVSRLGDADMEEVVHPLNAQSKNPYKFIKVASSPVSTACSWWYKRDPVFYRSFGHVCGVQGPGIDAVNAHVDRVFNMILLAYDNLAKSSDSEDTLKVFLLPEWALGRRYPITPVNGTQYKDFIEPLNFEEMQHIIFELVAKMQKSGLDFSDWLLVPGSIYWGVKVNVRLSDGAFHQYAVFNTAPVFYRGDLVWVHNKFIQADNLAKEEIWGYELVQKFPFDPVHDIGCTTRIGTAGVICGTAQFKAVVQREDSVEAAEALQKWGLTHPADAILVNGLAVGLDICADYRASRARDMLSGNPVMDVFDLQLMISSGMTFDTRETENGTAAALALRQGGMAISSDGIVGWGTGTNLFVANFHKDEFWNSTGRKFKFHLEVGKHFLQKTADLLYSWAAGCHLFSDSYNVKFCQLCQNPLAFAQQAGVSLGYGLQTFCDTEAGNWHVLKVWKTQLALPDTNLDHYKNSIGKATVLNGITIREKPSKVEKSSVKSTPSVTPDNLPAQVHQMWSNRVQVVSKPAPAVRVTPQANGLAVRTFIRPTIVKRIVYHQPTVVKRIVQEPPVVKRIVSEPTVVKRIVSDPVVSRTVVNPVLSRPIVFNPVLSRPIVSVSKLCPNGNACWVSGACRYVSSWIGMTEMICKSSYHGIWCPSPQCTR